jgi:transcription antitermination protein NusB
MLDKKKRLVASRQKARHYAVQGLYQWQMNDSSWSEIASQFLTEYSLKKQEATYFKLLLQNCVDRAEEFDQLLLPHMDRSVAEVGCVEMAVLRLGCFELKEGIDIPYRVVINESVNLAKKFAATDSYKFINGVLDKLALELREIEISQK